MTATNHALTGATIATLVRQPYLAIPLAFLSHFFCDALPHFDIKFKFEESLVPFKKRLELFNKERIYNDHSLSILKDSSSLCESVIVRSRRVLNMIKAFNSGLFFAS